MGESVAFGFGLSFSVFSMLCRQLRVQAGCTNGIGYG